MPDDRTLSLSTVTATIHAPIEKVDIGDWLFHLADAEYQRCSQAHIAAGTSSTPSRWPDSSSANPISQKFVRVTCCNSGSVPAGEIRTIGRPA